jgi:hypothetical protein
MPYQLLKIRKRRSFKALKRPFTDQLFTNFFRAWHRTLDWWENDITREDLSYWPVRNKPWPPRPRCPRAIWFSAARVRLPKGKKSVPSNGRADMYLRLCKKNSSRSSYYEFNIEAKKYWCSDAAKGQLSPSSSSYARRWMIAEE